MKKWVICVAINSLLIGLLPVNVLANNISYRINEQSNAAEQLISEDSLPSLTLRDSGLKPFASDTSESMSIDNAETKETEITNSDLSEVPLNTQQAEEEKEPTRSLRTGRAYQDFSYLGSGSDCIDVGIDGFSYAQFFNPESIIISDYYWSNNNTTEYFEYDLKDGNAYVKGNSIPINQKEGSYMVGTKVWGITYDGSKVSLPGGLFYEVLRTDSEVIITNETGQQIINGQGGMPRNPVSITVGRPASDDYGVATYHWEIAGPDGYLLEGDQTTELPKAAELQQLKPGVYTVANTVSETIPRGSWLYGKTGINGELLTVSATSVGSFAVGQLSRLTVNHWLHGAQSPFESHTFDASPGTPYETTPTLTIPQGYLLDTTKLPPNQTGHYQEDGTTVDFYYQKKVTSVTTHYIDEATGEAISGVAPVMVSGEYQHPYQTQKKAIKGYEFIEVDPSGASATGYHGLADLEVRYRYRKKTTNLIVRHVDLNGQPIEAVEAAETRSPGKYQEPYEAQPVAIPGYRYAKVAPLSGDANGKYDDTDTIVIFMYDRIMGGLLVKYVDLDGKIIASEKTEYGAWGSKYETQALDIVGYELADIPLNQSGVYSEALIEVIYVYQKAKATVKVNHQLEDGTELSPPAILQGRVGEEYAAKPVRIADYIVIRVVGHLTGRYSQNQQEVTFVYTELLPPEISDSFAGAKVVTGTGIPHSHVLVTLPTNKILTVQVDELGNWEVIVPDGGSLSVGDVIKAVTYDYFTEFRSKEAVSVVRAIEELVGPTKPTLPVLPIKPESPKEQEISAETSQVVKPKKASSTSTSLRNLPKTAEKQSVLLNVLGINMLLLAFVMFVRKNKQ